MRWVEASATTFLYLIFMDLTLIAQVLMTRLFGGPAQFPRVVRRSLLNELQQQSASGMHHAQFMKPHCEKFRSSWPSTFIPEQFLPPFLGPKNTTNFAALKVVLTSWCCL